MHARHQIRLVTAALLGMCSCTGRDHREVPAAPDEPDYAAFAEDDNTFFRRMRAEVSDEDRTDVTRSYLMRSVKELLRARAIEGGMQKPRRQALDDLLRRTLALACEIGPSSTAALQHLATTSIEELYPLDRLDEIIFVSCSMFVISNGKEVRGTKPLIRF